jgi:hypothetical protein
VAAKAPPAAVAGATRDLTTVRSPAKIIALVAALVLPVGAVAGVLPDDRGDVMYHRYEGGGVTIDGPSVLVRKQAGKNFSIVGNYYVDMISSASIDVITQASPYTEERTQWSMGVDYLRGNTTMSVNFVSSEESDFDAKTYAFSVSEDMFGDLTTLTLSYAYGEDVVGRSDDPTFRRDNRRQHYGVGLTQILTRNLIATLNFETVTDEGFLNNPYRSVRYRDPASALGYSFEPELYPETRTSNALGLRARYFLPYRAAIEGEYRYFTDTWDIDAHTAAMTYVHPWGPFTFEGKFRYHDQTGAAFFNDLFPRSEATNFRGRDKELSALTSYTFRGRVSYEFIDPNKGWGIFKRGTLNFTFDHLIIDYQEFRDISQNAPVGEEPLYELTANIYQIFVSFWY